MRKLKINGSITTEPFNILSALQCFYQGLYTSINKNVDATAKIESFLGDLNIPKLSEEQRLSCEGEITSGECALVLESFQNNKSPGKDGIPIKFYRKFWPLLSEQMNALRKVKCHDLKSKQLLRSLRKKAKTAPS